MTIPTERYYALIKTREFLRALLDPKQTPKVPKSIRSQAYSCLRHYPGDLYLDYVAERVPEHFEKDKADGAVVAASNKRKR